MTDIYDNFKNNAYRNKMGYPKPPIEPKAPTNPTPADFRTLADDMEQYALKLEEYKARVKEYEAESSRLMHLFYSDMQEYLGYDPNCLMAQLLLNKAWDLGHAYGLSDVFSHMQDLMKIYNLHHKILNK